MPSGSPVFAALVEAMVPPGGAFAAGGLDLVSAADLDSFIGGRGLPAARGLRLGLRLLDLCPFLLAPRHGRRFSRLALAERIAVLEAWERSRLVPLRQLVHMLKLLIMVHVYSRPEVEVQLGYVHPLLRVPRPEAAA